MEASHRVETSFRRLLVGGTLADLQTSASPSGQRRLAFATFGIGGTHFGDGTRSSIQISGTGVTGSSGGVAVARGSATVTLELGPNPLVISGTVGSARTSAPFEQFAIGGLASGVLQPTVLSQRIAMAVLPTTYAIGKSMRMYRFSIPYGSGRAYSWNAKVDGKFGVAVGAGRGTGMDGSDSADLGDRNARRPHHGRRRNWLNAPRAPSIVQNGVTYRAAPTGRRTQALHHDPVWRLVAVTRRRRVTPPAVHPTAASAARGTASTRATELRRGRVPNCSASDRQNDNAPVDGAPVIVVRICRSTRCPPRAGVSSPCTRAARWRTPAPGADVGRHSSSA